MSTPPPSDKELLDARALVALAGLGPIPVDEMGRLACEIAATRADLARLRKLDLDGIEPAFAGSIPNGG